MKKNIQEFLNKNIKMILKLQHNTKIKQNSIYKNSQILKFTVMGLIVVTFLVFTSAFYIPDAARNMQYGVGSLISLGQNKFIVKRAVWDKSKNLIELAYSFDQQNLEATVFLGIFDENGKTINYEVTNMFNADELSYIQFKVPDSFYYYKITISTSETHDIVSDISNQNVFSNNNTNSNNSKTETNSATVSIDSRYIDTGNVIEKNENWKKAIIDQKEEILNSLKSKNNTSIDELIKLQNQIDKLKKEI